MGNEKKINHLEIIVPCFNEEACIQLFYNKVQAIMKPLTKYTFSFLFIDDGSVDKTLKVIELLANEDENHVKYISFARNFGKESAMYAGLFASTGDMVVLMDCDLQHPPDILPEMIEAIESGYDCCAGRRKNRNGEPMIRSFFANMFYKLVNKMAMVRMEPGATDFRLMTRQMVDAILLLSERERFSKGIFSWVGFDIKWIEFENVERIAGQTTWSFFKLMLYAVSGIVAFSTTPLRIASVLGAFIVISAFIYGLYMVIIILFFNRVIQPFVPLLAVLLLLIGIIIMLLGIIGEYLARLYMEVKQRPIFISKVTNIKNKGGDNE